MIWLIKEFEKIWKVMMKGLLANELFFKIRRKKIFLFYNSLLLNVFEIGDLLEKNLLHEKLNFS